jgi:hypothetical protein
LHRHRDTGLGLGGTCRYYDGNDSIYCLGLLSDCAQSRAHGYLRTIEQQVARADSRLSEAAAAAVRLRAQRAEAGEILDLTKSATSAVTLAWRLHEELRLPVPHAP